jgi:hypothetical protein
MAFMLGHFEVDDYDGWKRDRFDRDPPGRKQVGKGHQIFRGVEDPRQIFVGVQFESVEDASSFRERLLASQVLEGVNVKTEPAVVEVADTAEY